MIDTLKKPHITLMECLLEVILIRRYSEISEVVKCTYLISFAVSNFLIITSMNSLSCINYTLLTYHVGRVPEKETTKN